MDDTISLHVFKSSFKPLLTLLSEHNISYEMREVRAGVPMASGGTLKIVKAVVENKDFWLALAGVLIAYVHASHDRKVIVTSCRGDVVQVVQAEGLTKEELLSVLQQAQSITAFDVSKGEAGQRPPCSPPAVK